ncbi:MAG: DUF2255 family protein [Acidimicrobiia bacterium]
MATQTDFQRLKDADEVFIETRSAESTYRTVIWVAADRDTLYVRSYRGDSGRWYQRALADSDVALTLDDIRVEFTAVPAVDDVSIERASEGFVRKYPAGPSLDGMVAPGVLHTTMRLEPV